MFKQIQPLLEDGRAFTLILSATKDGQIRCNFIPTATKDDTEQDKPLLTPLTITGTAQELDEGLADAISDYAEAYISMRESVAATKKEMRDAKAQEEAERKAKQEKRGSGASKKQDTKAPTPAEAKAAKEPAAPSLFDGPAATDEAETTTSDDDTEVFE